jgi:cytidyltransferase-like protein
MTAEQRKKELPGAILRWYGIEKGSRVACIVTEKGCSTQTAESLEEMGLWVTRIPLGQIERGYETEGGQRTDQEHTNTLSASAASGVPGSYDIITAIDIISYAHNPAAMLRQARGLLRPNGRLLLAADNRLGIRYFCGDRDAFTWKNYDGIENYTHLQLWERAAMEGRAYAMSELEAFLEEAGFARRRFYSVFPRLENPQLLLAHGYIPNEGLDIRLFPEYNSPETVFLLEEELYPSLLENGLLHAMANAFFVECPISGPFHPADQVTLSGERGPENAMATILKQGGRVEKRALYPAGQERIRRLYENNCYLTGRGVSMIPGKLQGEAFVMPYVPGIPANDCLRGLLAADKEAFLARLDELWEIILNSSEHAAPEEVDWEKFEPGWEKRKKDDPDREKWGRLARAFGEGPGGPGPILKRGYVDLVSLNCFYHKERFVFYDQELYLENVPARAILLRTIEFIYKFNDHLDTVIPRWDLFERYGIGEHMGLYQRFVSLFLARLRADDGLSDYYKEGRREYETVTENRRRLNYQAGSYEKIFRDIFHHTKGRRLYLFGSGKYARLFQERYGSLFPIAGCLDNDRTRQGKEAWGLPVCGPEILDTMNPAEYKVMVCIRDYMPVVKQLMRRGVPNFSVYDPEKTYPCGMGGQTERQTFPRTENTGKNGLPLPPGNRMPDRAGGSTPETAEKDPKTGAASPAWEKPYNVGYVAGVFDMFHMGHLNLLRRAKEQCSHLIVGVVTDEGVIRHKRSRPRIPFQERLAIVAACRYVDEAVEIPLDRGDTDEAYRRYGFDVQFSGSDYADDPRWQAKREFLQRNGSDMVFFPYTEGVSTTMLKDMLDREKNESSENG